MADYLRTVRDLQNALAAVDPAARVYFGVLDNDRTAVKRVVQDDDGVVIIEPVPVADLTPSLDRPHDPA